MAIAPEGVAALVNLFRVKGGRGAEVEYTATGGTFPACKIERLLQAANVADERVGGC